MRKLVRVVRLSRLSAGLRRSNCRIYTSLPPDDGLLASPKHVEVQWLNKLKINSASS
jgi:hypothetical protein